MKHKQNKEMLPEYDFSKGIRGKYAKQFAAGTNIIVLAPDVAKNFPDSDAVNETLRAVAKIAMRSKKRQSNPA
jgi:hypothetical protein